MVALVRTLLLAVLLSLAAAPARASEPAAVVGEGDGTLSLLGGVRLVPNHAFTSQLERDGLSPDHPLLHPYGLLTAGYQIDPMLHVAVDFGYGWETTHTATGDALAKSFTLLFALDATFFSRSWGQAYFGGGLGYSLNTFERSGIALESNSTAGLVKAGFLLRLTKLFALVIEDRYILSSASWPAMNSNVNVGGNVLTVGLMVHFFSSEDRHTMGH